MSGLSNSGLVIPRAIDVLTIGVGTQTLSNSTVSDQDFTALMTLPASILYTNRVLRITTAVEHVTGTSSVTLNWYLKMGSTKVFTQTAGLNIGDNITVSAVYTWLIFGRAAAGAAAATTTAAQHIPGIGSAAMNSTNQPVNLATNGTLDIVPGLTYSGTGGTESCELQAWMVELIKFGS